MIAVTGADGQPLPWAYFWFSGVLSSFLDNAPTYLVFFNLAGGDPAVLMSTLAPTLAARGARSERSARSGRSERSARSDADVSPPWDGLAACLRYVARAPFDPAVEFALPSPFVPPSAPLSRAF